MSKSPSKIPSNDIEAIDEQDEQNSVSDAESNIDAKKAPVSLKLAGKQSSSSNVKGGPNKKFQKMGRMASIAVTATRQDDVEEGISEEKVKTMIQKAIEDASDIFQLEAKNMEADKLVFETKMRKTMQDLVAPVVEQGVKHKEQFLVHQKLLGEFETRVGFIEYDLYKSDKKEDRFEELFRKIAEMELQRSADLESIKLLWVKHKQELEDILFNQDQKLLKVEQFETILKEQTNRFETVEARMQWHVE